VVDESYRSEIIEMQRELTCRPALGPENGGSGKHDKGGYVKKLDLKYRYAAAHRQDCAPPTPEDSPVVSSLARAIHEVTGQTARPMGIGGGTVAAFFREAGLPAAVWSTTSQTAHQPNEYCSIRNLITDAKIMATVFLSS